MIARLRNELGGAQQALSVARERLGEADDNARQKIAASEQAASSNADRLAQLTRKLDQTQRALRLAEAQRATLMARLSRSEVEAAQDQVRRQEETRSDLEQLEKKLRQLAAEREKIATERDKAAGERDRLRSRVGELEQKLSLQQSRQPPRVVANAHTAPAVPPAATPAPEPRVASLPPLPAVPQAPAAVDVTPTPVAASAVPTVSTAPAASAATTMTAPAEPAAPQVAYAPSVATPATAVSATPVAVTPAVTTSAVPAVSTSPAASTATAMAVPAERRPRRQLLTRRRRRNFSVRRLRLAVPAVAHGGIAQFERVLASTGVDVRNLFSQYGVSRGQGGPYIPNPRGSTPETLSAEKLIALSRMVKSLPVAAPLQSYEIGSRFGTRGDPINRHLALHTGTDFRAPYMSPVYATAAGVVTFSGYRDDYGKIVEIDHGNGLVTRYGHLNRAAVSVGQRVAAQTQIGYLGSTGRATGPHVHYEVVVNGEPQDPEKFIALGRIVPAVAQR